MSTAPVKVAASSDADHAISLIVLAFADDPAARWLYPEAAGFLANFPRFVQAFGGKAFDAGTAHVIEGTAAALWFAPGVEPDEEPLIALIQASVTAQRQEPVFAVLEQMGAYHPQRPHWYLPLIGTDPRQQGNGHGSALLRYALAACNAQGHPAYLEATSERNLALYRRHGFETLGTIQEGDGPPIYPMLREPR